MHTHIGGDTHAHLNGVYLWVVQSLEAFVFVFRLFCTFTEFSAVTGIISVIRK